MAGFLDEYEDVIMDRGRVRRHYIGSWFMLDLPASLPYIFVNRYMPEKTPLGVFIMCGPTIRRTLMPRPPFAPVFSAARMRRRAPTVCGACGGGVPSFRGPHNHANLQVLQSEAAELPSIGILRSRTQHVPQTAASPPVLTSTAMSFFRSSPHVFSAYSLLQVRHAEVAAAASRLPLHGKVP